MINGGDESVDSAGAPAAPESWGELRSRTVTWFDPQLTRGAGADLTGLDYVRAIADGRVAPQPMASVIGWRLISVEQGQVTVGARPDQSLLNAIGLVHGGVLCTLMDAAMGMSTRTTLGPRQFAVSIELKVSFLKPLPYDGGEVTVTGRVLKPGRRVSFAEAHAYSPEGALIGHGSSSLATVAS